MLNVLVVYAVNEEKVNLTMPNCNFHYCKTGVGKVSAALAVEKSIEAYKPEIVLNIGTAGSVKFPVGTIHLCCKFVDRDMEKLHAFGVPYMEDFTDEVQQLPFFKDWQFDSTCNTGDTFLTEADGTGDVFDMESFAIARVCRKHQIPFVGVKYVTDKIGENSVKHWEEKLAEAQAGLQQFVDENHLQVPDDYLSKDVKGIVDCYQMERHPEGGWFKEVYRSAMDVVSSNKENSRSALTSIYYLLADSDFSAFHRIQSPEVWYYHKGMPLIIHEIDVNGNYGATELSEETGMLQYTVEPGVWFAAELKDSYGYALVSCAVAPGFEFEDFELAEKSELVKFFPQQSGVINRLIR
ncbi:cupin domain-containing protein [Carboxylicivirga linearis]|uniref:Cupin domain-containing protein n=1 Tax=Carboxylicivirga linearis TaxID=1628157 RepID=A0ABS5JU11_9BACT|nr:cupin domain-containing protein [Carboxylicivirga linearis]MBS2097856.1 cupin domain-containing protein [Carboxylicivirga linearis]